MSIRWGGLEEFKADLRQLPDRLRDRAAGIVQNAAEVAETSVVQAYPLGPTGNLRGRVTLSTRTASPYAIGVQVASRAPHAYLFEKGTVRRRTKSGADRGVMPKGNVFIPNMMRRRERMYDELKSMLVDEGFRVSGDA